MANEDTKLIGRTITALFRTGLGEAQEVLPGIAPAHYLSVVVEIDSERLFELTHDGFHPWSSQEKLVPLDPKEPGTESEELVLGERIEAIEQDEAGIAEVRLGNETLISVFTEVGTQLVIR